MITVELNERDKWSGSIDDLYALLERQEGLTCWYPVVDNQAQMIVLSGTTTEEGLVSIENKLVGLDGILYVTQKEPLTVGVALALSRPVQGNDFVRLGHVVREKLGLDDLRGNGGTTCDRPLLVERFNGKSLDVTDLQLYAAVREQKTSQTGNENAPHDSSNGRTTHEPWMDTLYFIQGSTRPQKIAFNLTIILDNLFPKVFRWNQYSKSIDIIVHDGLTDPQKKAATNLQRYSEKRVPLAVQEYVFLKTQVEFGKEAIVDAIYLLAERHSFHPLHDYLNNCRRDDKSRIDTFFIDYFGAEDTPHNRRIGRCFLIGAVARAFEPGCKVDNSVILEGPQGLKKTSGIEALAGEFFASTQITLGDKDSKMAASSSWFIEMAELDSIKKAEGKAMKAFLTTRVDFYREPYGASYKKTPRTCILIGSTNEVEYLAPDDSGHRRPWPVLCHAIDIAGLLRDRDALWAEAVEIYKAHATCPACYESKDTVFGQAARCAAHRWWLDKEGEEEAAAVALEREEADGDASLEGLIRRWWNGMSPDKRPRRFEMLLIQEDVLKMEELEIAKNGKNIAIGRALSRIGFVRKHERIPGSKPPKFKPWHYEPTSELLENPKIEGKRNLGRVIALASTPKKDHP